MWWKFLKRNKTAATGISNEDAQNLRESGVAPLSAVTKKVRHVELVTKKMSTATLAGQYRSRFKGHGMQFSDLRLYQYGDEIRHIDWRTSSRTQEIYVKTYEEERELHIVLAVDLSASVAFGSTGSDKREILAIALATISFSAIANNDRVGLLLFTDKVERYVPAKKGRKHILRIIDEILTYQPKSKGSNLTAAQTFLQSVLKQGTIVILASDFFSTFEKKKMTLLARKHDLICLRASDPRDRLMPNVGLLMLEDPETGETALVDTRSSSFRSEYANQQKTLANTTKVNLERSGAAVIEIATDSDAALELQKFFRSRRGGRR